METCPSKNNDSSLLDEDQSSLATCDGVVCYAGVDWWYHNRGHSECQLMKRLASRVPVLWVNSIGMRAPSPGKTELPLRRYWRKLCSTLKGLRHDESGMWIYSPLFVPRYTPRIVKLNGVLLAFQIKLLRFCLGMKNPAVFVTVPTAAPAVMRSRWGRIVFNRSDEFSAFREADSSFIAPLEQCLLKIADTVLYVNRRLFNRECSQLHDARFLGHGVDYTLFRSARDQMNNRPIPSPIRNIPRPIVGFYGALDDYTVDLELLIKVARHIYPATLLIIGPKAMDITCLQAEPNVIYLGPIPYQQVPEYAAHFDVGLMPWLQNDWIAGCNPIKLKEYLALGFPVVSTRFPELLPYENLVYPASSHSEFLKCIDLALRETDSFLPDQRRQSIMEDSWENLANQVAAMLHLPHVSKE